MSGRPQFKKRSRDERLRLEPDSHQKNDDSEEGDEEMNQRYKFKGAVSNRKELRKQKREEKKLRNKEFYLKKYHVEERVQAQRPEKQSRPVKRQKKENFEETVSDEKRLRKPQKPQKTVHKKEEESPMPAPQPSAKAKKASSLEQMLVARGVIPAPLALSAEDEEKDQRVIKQMERKLFINKKAKKSVGQGLDMFLKPFEDASDEDEFAQLRYLQDEGSVDAVDDAGTGIEAPPDDMDVVPSDRDEDDFAQSGEHDNSASGLSEGEDDEVEEEPSDDVEDDAEDEGEGEDQSDSDEVELRKQSSPSVLKPTEMTSAYIPPHLRQKAAPGDDRVKKEVRGQVNRLAEATLPSILRWLVEQQKSRKTAGVIDLFDEEILANCTNEKLDVSQLTPVYASTIAFLHGAVGPHVGGSFLEAAAKLFASALDSASAVSCRNLVNLISHLYSFKVIHASLVFDIIERLLDQFNELAVDLMLVLIRGVGLNLRADDPAALKTIVTKVFSAAKSAGVNVAKYKGGEAFGTTGNDDDEQVTSSKRMEFMLDTILNLKNNKLKAVETPANVMLGRLKKQVMKELKDTHRVDALETLRIALVDLLDPTSKGRYWLVGSAFAAPSAREQQAKRDTLIEAEAGVDVEVLKLARLHRMNTESKRAVFAILISSDDYMDAFERISRLQLKAKQERDIASVLIYCLCQEKSFNPFYAHLANHLCSSTASLKFTFKIAVWDHIKALGQGDEKALKDFKKMAELLARLLIDSSLSLTVFKAMEIESMPSHVKDFFEMALTFIFGSASSLIRQLFGSLGDISQAQDRELIASQLSRFLKSLKRRYENASESAYAYAGVSREHLVNACEMSRSLLKIARKGTKDSSQL